MEKGEIPDPPVNETEQFKELEEWENKVTTAETEKANQLLLKLATDENKRKLQEELEKFKNLENLRAVERLASEEAHQRQIFEIKEHNRELSSEIQHLKDRLAAKKRKPEEARCTFRFKTAIPEMKMKFTRLESMEEIKARETAWNLKGNVRGRFRISSKVPVKLSQGEALITFEEENVAQELIRKQQHRVLLENGKTVVLKAQPIALGIGVAFELDTHLSLQSMAVSNIPKLNIPEEWVRDKLELHFLRLGGQVQNMRYDRLSPMAWITFAQPQAAKDIVRYNECPFQASGQAHQIQISPHIQGGLKGFQLFSGISRRTILLTGIAGVEEDEECMQDMVAIHFQKPSNGGGEVEYIKYVSKGTKAAYFEIGDGL